MAEDAAQPVLRRAFLLLQQRLRRSGQCRSVDQRIAHPVDEHRRRAYSFHAIATGAGWDYHAIWWSADGKRIINGNDEGVILSSDGGANFWQPYDLPISQPYHVGFDRDVPYYRVCVGLQDDNSWCGPSTSNSYVGVMNRDWYTVGPGDGMWALFDPSDPSYIWSTSTDSDTGQVYLFNEATKQIVRRLARRRVERRDCRTRPALPVELGYADCIHQRWEGTDRRQRRFRKRRSRTDLDGISGDLTRNDPSKQSDSGGPIATTYRARRRYDTILYIATTPLDDAMIWATTDDGVVQLTRDRGDHWTERLAAGVARPAVGTRYGTRRRTRGCRAPPSSPSSAICSATTGLTCCVPTITASTGARLPVICRPNQFARSDPSGSA